MLCCVIVKVDFTHIFQGYFTGAGAIIWYDWLSASEVTLKDMGK